MLCQQYMDVGLVKQIYWRFNVPTAYRTLLRRRCFISEAEQVDVGGRFVTSQEYQRSIIKSNDDAPSNMQQWSCHISGRSRYIRVLDEHDRPSYSRHYTQVLR